MDKATKEKIVEALVAALDIPPSYYEKAHKRYRNLGEWFERDGGLTRRHHPRIYPQGSFRLGTVIRPLHEDETYDLDVGCRLELGITRTTHSQADLKSLVGQELEAYRQARRIENELQERHRCWTLEYADELSFHMDIVPSIPGDITKQASLAEAMVKRGLTRPLAEDVSRHSGNITDNRLPTYRIIHPDWRISNSEGYARWFESRIETARRQMEMVAMMAKQAHVEKLPAWKWKSPLQKAVQYLKRHRDSMFVAQPDSKPISIILTTLAAAAYQGEEDLVDALDRILRDMDSYVLPTQPRVPNPVNPAEDFADKWHNPEYAHLNLEGNFQDWLRQARVDFKSLDGLTSEEEIHKFTFKKFAARIPVNEIEKILPLIPTPDERRSVHIITDRPARPWCR
jgi:hypothetical protein